MREYCGYKSHKNNVEKYYLRMLMPQNVMLAVLREATNEGNPGEMEESLP